MICIMSGSPLYQSKSSMCCAQIAVIIFAFSVICVYLEKKCFTVRIGDEKVGDTADSNREES